MRVHSDSMSDGNICSEIHTSGLFLCNSENAFWSCLSINVSLSHFLHRRCVDEYRTSAVVAMYCIVLWRIELLVVDDMVGRYDAFVLFVLLPSLLFVEKL